MRENELTWKIASISAVSRLNPSNVTSKCKMNLTVIQCIIRVHSVRSITRKASSTLSMLGKKSADDILRAFLFSQEIRFWHVMPLSQMETIRTKCQILFSVFLACRVKKNLGRRHFEILFLFSQKIILTFHAKYLQCRQFACNVKSCFL